MLPFRRFQLLLLRLVALIAGVTIRINAFVLSQLSKMHVSPLSAHMLSDCLRVVLMRTNEVSLQSLQSILHSFLLS